MSSRVDAMAAFFYSFRTWLLAAAVACLWVAGLSVCAQEVMPAGSSAPVTNNGGLLSAPASASTVVDPEAGAKSAAPAEPSATVQSASIPTPTSGGAGSVVSEGPLKEARTMLWSRINQAKHEGIGTGVYVSAFKGIEEEVRSGKGADVIRPRIESLARSLKDQLDRGKLLKTQRPTPPSASQSPGSASPAGRGGGGLEGLASKLGSKDPAALIDKLKEKLSNGDLPDGLKDKILNSDEGRKLLEKFGQ